MIEAPYPVYRSPDSYTLGTPDYFRWLNGGDTGFREASSGGNDGFGPHDRYQPSNDAEIIGGRRGGSYPAPGLVASAAGPSAAAPAEPVTTPEIDNKLLIVAAVVLGVILISK